MLRVPNTGGKLPPVGGNFIQQKKWGNQEYHRPATQWSDGFTGSQASQWKGLQNQSGSGAATNANQVANLKGTVSQPMLQKISQQQPDGSKTETHMQYGNNQGAAGPVQPRGGAAGNVQGTPAYSAQFDPSQMQGANGAAMAAEAR